MTSRADYKQRGRSPRVRGSQKQDQSRQRRDPVDPRGCGGASTTPPAAPKPRGRSPRVRGSRRCGPGGGGGAGSIPAGAGEPRARPGRSPSRGVDPRGCGGARSRAITILPKRGRSPRVRGSQVRPPQQPHQRGSIPAGAGEPIPPARYCAKERVDPRGCGGAVAKHIIPSHDKGRSPRVRGSRRLIEQKLRGIGSIPAGAGEPRKGSTRRFNGGVDPRGCGGATRERRDHEEVWGRSPRVRGSLGRPPVQS